MLRHSARCRQSSGGTHLPPPGLTCVYGWWGHKYRLQGALKKEEGRARREGGSGYAQPPGPLQAEPPPSGCAQGGIGSRPTRSIGHMHI